jgi:hypothetical protein
VPGSFLVDTPERSHDARGQGGEYIEGIWENIMAAELGARGVDWY